MKNTRGIFGALFNENGDLRVADFFEQRRREKEFHQRVEDEIRFNPTHCIPSDHEVKH